MKKLKQFIATVVCAFSVLFATAAEPSPGYLDLNGVDRYMKIPSSSDFDIAQQGTQTVTLDVMLATDTGDLQSIIGNRFRRLQNGNNNDVSGFEIYNMTTYNSTGHVYPSSSWSASNINASKTMSAGSWAHLALVHDGAAGQIRYYINGVLKGSVATKNLALPCYADILVGCRYNMRDNTVSSIADIAGFTNARIDNLRIYSSALSASQVAADSDADTPLADAGIIAAYDFEDITGTTVPDISGNGHDGTLAGTWPEYGSEQTQYATLSIDSSDGGSLRVTLADGTVVQSGSEVPTGQDINVRAIPNTNYELRSLTLNGSDLTVDDDGKATFSIKGASTLVAKFAYSDAGLLKVPVFSMNENGSKFYRIPALIVAADGSLVAAADQRGSSLSDLPNTISIVTKRSTDGGHTWSDMTVVAQGNSATGKTYGDPAIVADRESGRIMLIYSGDNGFWHSTKTNRAGFYYSISSDNGQTWTDPVAFTDQVYQSSWRGAFASSGNAVQLSSGRIMFVANAHCSDTWGATTYCYACYSDDFGQTWHVSNAAQNLPADALGNEAKIIELANGDLLMSIRSTGKRRFSRSTDGGVTWSAAYQVNDLPEPGCNGDIIRFPSIDGRNRILHSLPDNSSIRQDVSVALSYDEGQTWPVKKQLIDGYSAYSSLAVLPDGSIGCLVEEGKWDSNLPGEDGFDLYFMRFSLDWLTDGADTYDPTSESDKDAPIFITIGQSNADGSAFFDAEIDSEMNSWYSSADNSRLLKMWYRSTQVQNQTSNSLGEAARWVIDGTTTDVEPGWLDLWYRNENTLGRTAMNMIHGYGTYSVGTGTDCAQGRRGMEGRFGIRYAEAYPAKPLYMIKLGVSGSFISSWANGQDDHNWDYFFDKMFRPAVESLLLQGKRPRLAGIWWMQGCADKNKDKAYYKECLERLVERCRAELGFEDGKIYVGHIVKPGESSLTPSGSVDFSQNVRDAQDEVAAAIDGVEIIDTKDCPMQYESSFSGYIHFNHEGVNRIGDILAEKVIADGPSGWDLFSTPGKWEMTDGKAVFVPSVGNPEISYTQDGSVITASIVYPGWSELKSFDMAEAGLSSPGYLELDGKDRFMRIEKSSDFDIPQGGSQTVTLDVMLETDTNDLQTFIGNRYRRLQNGNNNDVSGFEIYNMTTYNSTAHVYPSSSWSASNINASRTMTAGTWAHLALVHDGAAGQIRYYINGVLKGSVATKNLALPCYADILVGCRYNMKDNVVSSLADISGFANARIDNLRIYSSALSASQVALDSDSETPLEDAGVIAAYDFSRISDAKVTDISGNGHTGYLAGTWPAYSVPSYAVTVEEPENGSLTVFNGDVEIESGDMIEENTVLSVVAVPDPNCQLVAVKVNGEILEGDSFTVTGNMTVAAEFISKYNAPSGNSYSSNYLTSIATSGARKDIEVSYDAHPGIYSVLEQTVEAYPGKDFNLNLVANSVGAASSSTVYEDLRFCQAYIFADWNGSGEFALVNTIGTHAPGGNSPHTNMHIYGNYDDVMDISQPLEVPADVEPGTVARIRVVYQNAWANLGATTTPDPDAANLDKGIAYDIDVNIVEKNSFTVIANVTGGSATVEVGGEGGFVELPADGLELEKGTKVAVRFTRASSNHVLTAFEVNGVDDMDHMAALSQTIYSIPSIDDDYTFDVVYSLPQFTLTVVNNDSVDPETCYYGEFRDNMNQPIEMTGDNSVTVDKGSTVYFAIMAPAQESGYTYEFQSLLDNGEDVTDDLIPFGDDRMYFMTNISEDHILIIEQAYSGILAVGSDAAGSLKFNNGLLSVSADEAMIELFDVNGRLIRRVEATSMQVSDLPGGIYVAKATVPGATYSLKFVKF